MHRKTKGYIIALGLVILLGLYGATAHWRAADAPATPPPCGGTQVDEGVLRSALQELLLHEDTQAFLASLMPEPQEEEQLATRVASHLLNSGALHDLVHEIMTSPQFKDTIIALVQEPEVQAEIKASIDLDDIQFLMKELLSTPGGQVFIMDLLTEFLSPPGNH